MERIKYLLVLASILLGLGSCKTKSNLAEATPNSPINGTWVGEAYQYDVDSYWDMKFTCNMVDKVYKIEYPSLSCGGYWTLSKVKGNHLIFRETIERGIYTCTDQGTIKLEMVNDKEMNFYYYWPNDEILSAKGRLHKE